MEIINFYCKCCGVKICPKNAQEEHSEIFIPCVACEAKNVIAPYIINQTVIRDLWQIVGWRD